MMSQLNSLDETNLMTEKNLRFFVKGIRQHKPKLSANEEGIIVDNFRNLQKQVSRGVPIKTVIAKGISDTIRDLEKLQIKVPDMRDYQLGVLSIEGDNSEYKNFITQPSTSQEQKGESVKVTQVFDMTKSLEFQLFFNPSSLYTYKYVAMHSDYRDTSKDSAGTIKKFSWKFAPTRIIQTGFCNGTSDIGNITGMRLYQPRVPYVAAMNTNSKRVSILIEEFSAQSFGSSQNSTFHFIYRPIYVASQTSIELSTEDYNDGIYTFRKPIKSLDSITLVFKDPTNEIAFTAPFDAFFIAIEFTCLKDYDNADV